MIQTKKKDSIQIVWPLDPWNLHLKCGFWYIGGHQISFSQDRPEQWPRRWRHLECSPLRSVAFAEAVASTPGSQKRQKLNKWRHTVDGRNPAPVNLVNTPLFTGDSTSQVVQDFFHQQYDHDQNCGHPGFEFWSWHFQILVDLLPQISLHQTCPWSEISTPSVLPGGFTVEPPVVGVTFFLFQSSVLVKQCMWPFSNAWNPPYTRLHRKMEDFNFSTFSSFLASSRSSSSSPVQSSPRL